MGDNKSQLKLFVIFGLILASVFIAAADENIDKDKIIEINKEKLNEDTIDYLQKIADEKQEENYIVKFKNLIDENKLNKVELSKSYERFNTVKIKSNADDIKELLSDSEIEYIELDQNIEILSDNLPYGITKTNAPNVWNSTQGNNVKIAVLDTGVSLHSDLSIAGGISTISNDYTDTNGHGTAVIGIISALLNNEGLVGVAPESDIYAVKIMEGNSGDLSNAIEGVEWAIDNNMDIISMSFGMETYSQIFKEVLDEAYNNGILLIAAAGNNGENNILYPAAYSSVIAVGAVDENNERASFSSYGYNLELAAPGVNINSTALNNGYAVLSGTSMAVPHVTGVAALIKSYNRDLTNEQIRAKLRNDALDLGEAGKDDFFGYGLVQINLETINFTLQNESYFYEVFNITGYGTPQISYKFWLNGNGTIDDIDFVVGYYLIKKYLPKNITMDTIYVTENGTIILLYTNIVSFSDDFQDQYSPGDDGIVWINGNLSIQLYTTNPLPQAECYDVPGTGTLEYCFAESSSDMNNCDAYSGIIDCGYTICDSNSVIGSFHSIFNTFSAKTSSYYGEIYYSCVSPSALHEATNTLTYYVIDKKRGRCTNSTHFVYEGHYGSGNWIEYQDNTCVPTDLCDFTRDDEIEYTTKNAYIDPCYTPSYCDGKIEVNVVDSYKDPIPNSYIYLNGIYNDTSNEDGQKIITLNDLNCGVKQNISIYCYNNQSRLCGEKETALDFDGDYDSLIFDCNRCKEEKDLYLTLGDVSINEQDNQYNISIIVHTENINENNLNITFKGQNKDTGLVSEEKNTEISAENSDTTVNASVLMDLNNINYIHIYIDPNNNVNEPKDNNYVLVPAIKKKIPAYVNVSTGILVVDEAIEDYLKFFIDFKPESSNVPTIAIGRPPFNKKIDGELNQYTLNNYFHRWGYDNGLIFKDTRLNKPYNGIVSSFSKAPTGNEKYIIAYGNDIEGDIAAVKKLISASNILFDNYPPYFDIPIIVLDDYDTLAISLFDLMHNNESNAYYRQNNENFKKVVTNILLNNNYEISIKLVKTINDNTTLRMKHSNSDFTDNYKDAVVNISNPVVLSRGLHSNLFTWNDFGEGLAETGLDIWLIEMYGGPTTECDTCPAYTFTNLTDQYWPALIAGVQQYSGQSDLSYVGYDLGCSVALESLEDYNSGKNNAGRYLDNNGQWQLMDLSSTPIYNFIGVACVGNFTKVQTKLDSEELHAAKIIESINTNFYDMKSELPEHITAMDIKKYYATESFSWEQLVALYQILFHTPPGVSTWSALYEIVKPQINELFRNDFEFGGEPISINIYEELIRWYNTTNEPQIGKDVQLNRFAIIQSENTPFHSWLFGDSMNTDDFVSNKDQLEICKNVISNNKYYIGFGNYNHFNTNYLEQYGGNSFGDKGKVQDVIVDLLKGNIIVGGSQFTVISDNSNCN